MSRRFVHTVRVLVDRPAFRQYRERFNHESLNGDPRVAAEHRIAHYRDLDQGGSGCSFCARSPLW